MPAIKRAKGDEKMRADNIKRSSTGVYHIGSGSSANCNGRSGKFVNSSIDQASKAQASSFCKKCFGDDPKNRIERMVASGHLA